MIFKLIVLEDEGKKHKAQSTQESQHQRCKFLLNHALDADAAGLKDEAIKLYTDAAEIGLSIVSLLVHYYLCFYIIILVFHIFRKNSKDFIIF